MQQVTELFKKLTGSMVDNQELSTMLGHLVPAELKKRKKSKTTKKLKAIPITKEAKEHHHFVSTEDKELPKNEGRKSRMTTKGKLPLSDKHN